MRQNRETRTESLRLNRPRTARRLSAFFLREVDAVCPPRTVGDHSRGERPSGSGGGAQPPPHERQRGVRGVAEAPWPERGQGEPEAARQRAGEGGDPRRGGRTRPLLFLLRAAASTARVSGFCRAASRARGGLFPRSAAPGAGLLPAVAGCCAPCRAGGLARPAPGRFRREAPSLRAQRALGAKRRPCAL